MASENDETREQFEKRMFRYADADLIQQLTWYIDYDGEHPNEPITWDDERREIFTEKQAQTKSRST